MTALTDDLSRPLGVADAASTGEARSVPRWLLTGSAAVLVAASAAIGGVVLFGDPGGGVPRVRVAIGAVPAERPATRPDAGPELPVVRTGEPPRRSGGEIENASGVSVTRPDGASAPDSVIVRVPDATDLAPGGPDDSLLERSRFGLLPRIGPTGLKPMDAYARPAEGLPGGNVPAGRVAIVVGGVGIGQSATAAVLAKLPPAVTVALAPYAPDLDVVARRAREGGHEVMLQVPMEPFDYPDSDPGPHTLLAAAKPAELTEHLQWALGRFTGYVGVMNYMGGKLTADGRALTPVLKELAGRGLAFLDDGSSSRSVARNTNVPGLRVGRADLVIDAAPQPDAIDRALARLEAAAAGGMVAIGTASALPVTVDRIARWAASLQSRGILLVPVTTALRGEGVTR